MGVCIFFATAVDAHKQPYMEHLKCKKEKSKIEYNLPVIKLALSPHSFLKSSTWLGSFEALQIVVADGFSCLPFSPNS